MVDVIPEFVRFDGDDENGDDENDEVAEEEKEREEPEEGEEGEELREELAEEEEFEDNSGDGTIASSAKALPTEQQKRTKLLAMTRPTFIKFSRSPALHYLTTSR